MEALKFYDLSKKKVFVSSKYVVKLNKRGVRYAETVSPSGRRAFRILGKKKV